MTRINDHLRIVGAGPDAQIQCRCGQRIGPACENYKSHVLLREGPVQNAGPFVDPHRVGGERFVCREFFCPACVTLLDVEIAQAGEEFVWDVRLDVDAP
jgi:acetone carboxylase gamma subunit